MDFLNCLNYLTGNKNQGVLAQPRPFSAAGLCARLHERLPVRRTLPDPQLSAPWKRSRKNSDPQL